MLDRSTSPDGGEQVELTQWERPMHGSAEAEYQLFLKLSKQVLATQMRAKARSGALGLMRGQYAKAHLAITSAVLTVTPDLPEDLTVAHWRPGSVFKVALRFSTSSPMAGTDATPDWRGMALRLDHATGVQDLLLSNRPAQPARDAAQYAAMMDAAAGPRWLYWANLAAKIGPLEAARIRRDKAPGAPRSLAAETFWSGGAVLWGAAGPVQISLRPVDNADARQQRQADPEHLRKDLAARLKEGALAWEVCVHRFVNADRTPVEDASVPWRGSDPVVIGRLEIPARDILGIDAQNEAAGVEAMAFNPWNTHTDLRPLGNINRARKAVYHASAAHRDGTRFFTPVPLRNRVITSVLTAVFDGVNKVTPWFKLPTHLGLFNLAMYRHRLRAVNLIDREAPELVPQPQQPPAPIPEAVRDRRTFDGTMNDLSAPNMGKVGAPFGRNMPPDPRPELLHTPDPMTISKELLHRDSFIPATSINVLAAAWIQFQAHDWVQHSRYPLGRRDIIVPMPEGETWRNTPDGAEETEMRIAGDRPMDPSDPQPLTFPNRMSHWWDGSELYGTGEARAMSLLEGPKFRLEEGYLPRNLLGMEVTGFNESWWLGLSTMHTLFAKEHNSVVDMLRAAHRDWDDMRVYHTARLIVSALIAKIHTVEWTPAILAKDVIDIALNANWAGPTDALSKMGAWLADKHAMTGITDTLPDHHAAPYSLTEDFVTVYRLHPLLPDDFYLRHAGHGGLLEHLKFDDLQGRKTGKVMRRVGLENTLYSLGTAHPGAVTLHNYPNALQAFTRETAEGIERIDLSVVDIMRERSRGIPRYNKFREGLHKPPIRHWEDITPDPEDVRKLREIYGTLDKVDTMVGLFSEAPPPGFGFSETAFRIFILMATRRIQSDRFLTVDYRPEIYSKEGIAWIRENSMTSVILRQYPDLASVIPTDRSAFAPWRPRESA